MQVTYRDCLVGALLRRIEKLGDPNEEKTANVTIAGERVAVSRKNENGDWQVYVGVLNESRRIIPCYDWVDSSLEDLGIDPLYVRWYGFETIYFGGFHRDWLSTKLQIAYMKADESLLTSELVNDYALENIGRRNYGKYYPWN